MATSRLKLAFAKFFLRGADKRIIIIMGLLLLFGLIMLASASSVAAYAASQDGYYFVKRQALALVVGLPIFFVLANFSYQKLRGLSLTLLVINILFLIAVLFTPAKNGTHSWFNILGFGYQPSETLKFVYLTYLAAIFSGRHQAWPAFVRFLVSFGAVGLLVYLQPDVGTLFVLAVSAFAALMAARVPRQYLLSLLAVGLIGLVITVSLSGHQRERFRCLLDSDYGRQDSCFQVNQSLIALGSGGWLGRGLGESRQKYLYLPEVQNDFIFAIIGEELGWLFSVLVLVVFAWLFWIILQRAGRTKDEFARVLLVGFATWICCQALLNIGGIARVLPMTGVTLPFISYGGSSMISLLAAMGVIVNISREA
jgi:cell division protein FtsW